MPLRVDWLTNLGVSHGLVLANISCTYFKPLQYPGDIDVVMYAGHCGRSNLDTYYEIRCPDRPDELASPGHSTVVWFGHQADIVIEIPVAVRQLLRESC